MQSALQLTKQCVLCSAPGSRPDRPARVLRAACGNGNVKQSQCLDHVGNCSTYSTLQLPSRAALTATAAAAVLQICLPAVPALAVAADLPQPPAAAAVSIDNSSNNTSTSGSSWRPVLGDMSLTAVAAAAPDTQQVAEQDEYMDEITAEVAMPPELVSFMQKVEKGSLNSLNKLQEARRSVGFERTPDGRVLLLTEDGEPFQVKNDMGVPGLLLLRDAGGYCYYLPPPDNNSLVQIDLSDDAVVAQLFANHVWEELLEPLEVMETAEDEAAAAGQQQQQQPQGPRMRLEQLRLTERQFRTAASLAAGGQEMPEEPLEDLDAQEK